MAVTKKILKHKPTYNDNGQYNYDGSINKGIRENIDSKFIDLDLYTLSCPNDVNEEILKSDYIFQSPSYLKINKLKIKNRNVNYDLIDNNIRVAIVKGGVDNGSYSALVDYTNDSSNCIYQKTWGVHDEGWSPGTIIDGEKVVENFGVNNISASYTFSTDGANSSYDINNNFPLTFCDDENTGEDINIIIWMKSNARRGIGLRWTDKRKRRVEHYVISGSGFNDCTASLEERSGLPHIISLEYVMARHGDGGSGGAETPAFEVEEIEIEFVAPREVADITMITSIDGASMPVEVSTGDLFKLNPTSIPNRDWSDSLESLSGVDDFRPISIVTAGETDLQTYYEYGEALGASSPIRVDLTFDMKKTKPLNISSGVELDEYYTGGKFKFFVVDWNDKNNRIQSFDDIEDWPLDINSTLLLQKNDNTYKYANYLSQSVRETLDHFYQTPGIKNIKVVVFLYADTIEDKIQAVRWKLVTVRINIGVDDIYIEDFSDLGGPDYTTIPWPYTSPVISGVSNESQYYSSVDRILRKGKFSDTDLLDSILLKRTINNNELGKYIGKSDLSQVRYFKSGVFDMSYLLKIHNLSEDEEFHLYTDKEYWNGTGNKFSDESSVGSIFISEDVDPTLKSSCLFELNMGDIDNESIRDSAGNGIKGILIGDYRLEKSSRDIRMTRSSEMKLPLTDTKDKAF